MNALDINADRPAPRAVAAVHPTHTFRLLLRREFWENRGGFLKAPLIAGAISLFLLVLAIVFFEAVALPKIQDQNIQMSGERFAVNGLDLNALISKMDPEDLRHIGPAIDLSLYGASLWPFIVLAFVVFFYCLGSLYDERKDRSVLFWKSLPVSDSQTVLSKLVSAALVAPALATAAAIATMLGYLLIMSGFVLLHGANPITLLWGPGSPLSVAATLIAAIPIYALWALPTIGWLMFCSAWARSLPFLWAILIPVVATLLLGWITLMGVVDSDSFMWILQHVSSRSLLSAIPGTWMSAIPDSLLSDIEGPDSVSHLIGIRAMYSTLLSPHMWGGVVAGAALIFASVRLRRWRDEG